MHTVKALTSMTHYNVSLWLFAMNYQGHGFPSRA